MEDKPIIISHCTSDIQKKKLTKWDILSRSGLSQYFVVDHGNQFLAVYQAPSLIELWDISSSPVALASLTIPTNMSHEQTSAIDVCQCMVWSHCRDYLFSVFSAQNRPMVSDISSDRKDNSAVFYLWNISSGTIINSLRLAFDVDSASFLPSTANLILLGTAKHGHYVLLDCCSGEIRAVHHWGSVDGSNPVTSTITPPLIGQPVQLMSVVETGTDATLDTVYSTSPFSKITEMTEEMFDRAANGRHASLLSLSSATSITSQAATGGLWDRDSPPAFRVMSLPRSLQQKRCSSLIGCQETDVVGYLYLCETNAEGFEEMRKLRITARAYTWPEVGLCDSTVTGKYHIEGDSQSRYAESRLTFLSRCKKCGFQSVLTCSIYGSDKVKVKSFCLSSSHPPGVSPSESHSDLFILVTGTNGLAVLMDDIDRSEGAISDLRILDGHTLCTLAILGDSVSSSSDLLGGQRLPTAINDISAEGIGIDETGGVQGGEIDMKLKVNFPAFTITAACLVPPMAHSFSHLPGVAVITEYSTISSSTLLSNKLLLWQPQLPKIDDNMRIFGTSEDYDMRCQGSREAALLSSLPVTAEEMEKLLPSLLADSNVLPFNSLPITNLSKRNFIGSKSRDPLLVTSGRGQHQHFVVADLNGHIWYATRAPQSNFPGPMYPPGFTLMQRVKSYIEREDELDNIDVMHTHQRSDNETFGISSEISSLTIDVGVSPYFYHGIDSIVNTSDDKKGEKVCAPYKDIPYLSDRLPIRLIGDVRVAHLEAKVRAICNRKLCIAREKNIQTANRKKSVHAPSRVSKVSRKRKRPKGSSRTRQQTRNRGEGESINGDDCESLMPLDTIGEGDMDLENENENENESIRNNSRTLKPQVQDTDESGADTDNETEQVHVRPELIPTTEPLTSSHLPHSSHPRAILSCLSDALPVPRRITTGDFALRLQNEKELGLIIESHSSDGTIVADRLLQFEKEAVENIRKLAIRKEKTRIRRIFLKVEKAAAAKLLVDEAAVAAAAAAAAAAAEESSLMINDNGRSNAEVESNSKDVECSTAPSSEFLLPSCPQAVVADTVRVDETDKITMSDNVTDLTTLHDMSSLT